MELKRSVLDWSSKKKIIFSSLNDFPKAVELLMGLLYTLNIDYPKCLRYTFEVIQKVLMDIGGGQVLCVGSWFEKKTLKKDCVSKIQVTDLSFFFLVSSLTHMFTFSFHCLH